MICFFYLPTFSTPCMGHLLYLMFRCDEKFGNFMGTEHSLSCLAAYSSYTTTDKTCNIDCTETYYNCQDGRIQNQNCFSWLPNSQ